MLNFDLRPKLFSLSNAKHHPYVKWFCPRSGCQRQISRVNEPWLVADDMMWHVSCYTDRLADRKTE